MIVWAEDDKSFIVFERQDAKTIFRLQNDTIVGAAHLYKINDKAIDNSAALKPLPAYKLPHFIAI
jgi:hypothetical protein